MTVARLIGVERYESGTQRSINKRQVHIRVKAVDVLTPTLTLDHNHHFENSLK